MISKVINRFARAFTFGLIGSFGILAGATLAIAATTISGTGVSGDGPLVIDGASTIAIGTSTAAGITIGNPNATTTLLSPSLQYLNIPLGGMLNIANDDGITPDDPTNLFLLHATQTGNGPNEYFEPMYMQMDFTPNTDPSNPNEPGANGLYTKVLIHNNGSNERAGQIGGPNAEVDLDPGVTATDGYGFLSATNADLAGDGTSGWTRFASYECSNSDLSSPNIWCFSAYFPPDGIANSKQSRSNNPRLRGYICWM